MKTVARFSKSRIEMEFRSTEENDIFVELLMVSLRDQSLAETTQAYGRVADSLNAFF